MSSASHQSERHGDGVRGAEPSVGFVSSFDGLRALKADWSDVQAVGGVTSPFSMWEWQCSWWLHYGEPRARRQLAIVTVREGDMLSALLPTFVRHVGLPGATLRSLHLLGTAHESSDFLDVPQRDPARSDLLPLLVTHAHQRVEADRICFANLADDSPVLSRVRALATERGLQVAQYRTHTCPYVPIAGTWADYLASRGSSFRQTLGRRTRRFFERPGASFDYVTDASELPAALDDVFTLHRRRFAQKGARTRFVVDRRGAFHATLSRLMLDRGALRLFRLRVEGRTVATLYCFEQAARLFYFQGGIDPDWQRESVGTVLMGQVVKYAFDRGLVAFELLRGNEPYKLRWTDCTRHLVRVDLGMTPRGRLSVLLTSAYRSIQMVAPKARSAGLKN